MIISNQTDSDDKSFGATGQTSHVMLYHSCFKGKIFRPGK